MTRNPCESLPASDGTESRFLSAFEAPQSQSGFIRRRGTTRVVNGKPIRLSSDDMSSLMLDSEPLVFQSLVQIREGALPPISHVPPFRAISLRWNFPCCSARHFKGNEQDG